VCTGTPVYYEQMSRSGDEWPGQGGGCGECARVHQCIKSKLSGNEGPGQGGGGGGCVRVYRCTMSTQSGNECPGQGGDAASVYGYTSALRANSQGTSGRTLHGGGHGG